MDAGLLVEKFALMGARVRHSDDKAVVLDGWHRVLMNTERAAPFVLRVAFLD